MDQAIIDFKMPRFREIPNVGLYLEQTIKYINECLAPIDISITTSMLSNYVKKGYIDRPIKKQYYAEQIAYLMFIALAKQTLFMDNIPILVDLQKRTYPIQVAYDYFCSELENMLDYLFDLKDRPSEIGCDDTFAKKILRSIIISASHIIYLNKCLKDNTFQNIAQDE